MGIPATVANGTNRVGVLFQNIVSVSSFQRQKMLDVRGGLILSAPAIIGSIIGAQIAVDLDEARMRQAIGVLMVVMLFVILLRPKRWLQGELEKMGNGRPSFNSSFSSSSACTAAFYRPVSASSCWPGWCWVLAMIWYGPTP